MGEPTALYLEEVVIPHYLDRVEQLLRQGRKLQAIKVYKEATGFGLRDCKTVVDGIEQKIGLSGLSAEDIMYG